MDVQGVRRLAHRALASGGVVSSPRHVTWDVAGYCQNKLQREISARDYGDHPHRRVPGVRAERDFMWVTLMVRCGKCSNCLSYRTNIWARRASAEMMAARRTWFVTLTFTPQEQFQNLLLTRQRLAASGISFDALAVEHQFRERHRDLGALVTKFVKRLREANPDAPFRYLCVVEAHKSGDPHYHMLIHETGQGSVAKRTVQAQWQHGFSTCKLADVGTADYVCKYLGKQMAGRVRASCAYGANRLSQTIGKVSKKVRTAGTRVPRKHNDARECGDLAVRQVDTTPPHLTHDKAPHDPKSKVLHGSPGSGVEPHAKQRTVIPF